jgi:hypothetical protein
MDTSITINLLDNILGYLSQAATHIKEGETNDWKFAILHTVSAIELSLKLRLQDEHWSLIFSDIDQANIDKLKTGDFKSVTLKDSIERIKNILQDDLIDEVKNKLIELYDLRNKIQHYQISVNSNELLSKVAFGVNFVLDELRRVQDDADFEEVKSLYKAVLDKCDSFQEFVAARFALIKSEVEGETLIECPQCWNKTLIISGGEKPFCPYCMYSDTIEGLADQLNEKENIEICPECEVEACIYMITGAEDYMEWVCLSCGESGDYVRCERCNRLKNDDGESMCSDCTKDWIDDPHT